LAVLKEPVVAPLTLLTRRSTFLWSLASPSPALKMSFHLKVTAGRSSFGAMPDSTSGIAPSSPSALHLVARALQSPHPWHRSRFGVAFRGTVTVGGRLLAVVEREHDATSENFDAQMPGRRR